MNKDDDKQIISEYGNQDLRTILSNYLLEKFIEEINKQNNQENT